MLKIHKRYLKGLLKLGVTGMFTPQDFVHRLKSLILHSKNICMCTSWYHVCVPAGKGIQSFE